MSHPANKTALLDGGELVYQRIYMSRDPLATDDFAGDGTAVFAAGVSKWINVLTFSIWELVDGTKGAAVWAELGLKKDYVDSYIDEVHNITGISTGLLNNIPANSIILNAQMNIQTAITAVGNSVKLGLGPVASPVKYGLITALTKNSKSNSVPSATLVVTAEDVQINAVQTDGATIGTGALVTGSVRVRIAIRTFAAIPDAP